MYRSEADVSDETHLRLLSEVSFATCEVCEIVVFECLFWESLCDNLELIECQKALRVLGAFLFFSSAFLGTCEVLVRVGRRRKSNVSDLSVSVFLHTGHMFCVAVRFACWSFVWVMGQFHEAQLKQSSSCSLFGAMS